MNKLPKKKRDQLILVVLVTAIVLALIYFGWISSQDGNMSRIKSNTMAAQDKLQKIEDTIKKSTDVSMKLADINDALKQAETDMASGDTFAWTYDTIRHFKTPFKVDPTAGPPTTEDVDLLANYPFKQLKFTITGTAYYHDLGDFIAHFENNFPHIRVVNLALEPVGGTGDDSEKLSYRMDIIALIKPNGAAK
jgi:Tfp pilus assembly protein PilO